MKIITVKRTYINNEFDINAFLVALDKVLELNNNAIKFYTLENSIKVLNYPRSFSSDYKALTSIYRGTRKDNKYRYLEQYLTPEVVAKFESIISKNGKTKKRVAKMKSKTSIDEFISLYKKYKSLNEGPYSSYTLEKSKRLLGIDKSFRVTYSHLVSAIKGNSFKNEFSNLLNEENMQKLKDCGFLDDLKGEKSFNGHEFAQVVQAIASRLGEPDFAKNYNDYFNNKNKFNTQVKEVQEYSRDFALDFNSIANIMVGSISAFNSDFYNQLTSDVEEKIYWIALCKNQKIRRPFSIQEFMTLAKKEYFNGKKFSLSSSKRADNKIMKNYGRDYKLDCILVESSLLGLPTPAYIQNAITPKVRKELNSIGFGEIERINFKAFLNAWQNFLEVSQDEPDCSYLDFDKELSLEILDYKRSFARDYEYFAEVALNLNGDKKVSDVVTVYDNEYYRAMLDEADFMILPEYIKKKKLSKKNKLSENIIEGVTL